MNALAIYLPCRIYPQITTLDFTYCDWVTDASVTTLSSEFTQITALDLSNCDKITDAGVISFIIVVVIQLYVNV